MFHICLSGVAINLPCHLSSKHGTVALHGMGRHMHVLPRQTDAGIGRVFLEKAVARHILSLDLAEHCLRKKEKQRPKK